MYHCARCRELEIALAETEKTLQRLECENDELKEYLAEAESAVERRREVEA